MKKVFNTILAVVAISAVAFGSYKAYGSYFAANMSEEDRLMAENVEALANESEAKKNTNLAIEYNYGADYYVKGWKVDVNVSASIKAALGKLIGKHVSSDSKFVSDIEKYTVYTKKDQYQKNCVHNIEGANCICSDYNNGKWINKPSTPPSWWGKNSDWCN